MGHEKFDYNYATAYTYTLYKYLHFTNTNELIEWLFESETVGGAVAFPTFREYQSLASLSSYGGVAEEIEGIANAADYHHHKGSEVG